VCVCAKEVRYITVWWLAWLLWMATILVTFSHLDVWAW